ncbi:MAG: DUF2442 domain-containing protein [candidate division KSB1 bacterium]|nr:DUF2442 domain-containing protein [candidate division KSB1 bacterium]MDZ7303770.1 DUF2442 domain-containing protein [candidate division KSB1 bacterium]MDZ7313029.1 DUF2442 domain-containing protein [candidate division KSB1 bacterium]
MKLERLVRVKSVEVLNDFRVRLEFTDDTQREIDLEPYLHGPIFEPIRNNPLLFRSVKVDKRMGTIVWDNGADIDPDVLYYGIKPAWTEMEKEPEREMYEHKVVV